MESIVPALDYYHVAYEPVPPLLRGANSRPLSAEEITVSSEMLLQTATRHRCPYWLLEGRQHVREQPQALHDWMREDFFPRVQLALSQRPCVAFLVSPEVWAGLPNKGYPNPLTWQTYAMHLAWFTDEDPALAWLAKQRALLSARQ